MRQIKVVKRRAHRREDGGKVTEGACKSIKQNKITKESVNNMK
jgi:hypothetical protein